MSKKNLISDGTFTWTDATTISKANPDGDLTSDVNARVGFVFVTFNPNLTDEDGNILYEEKNSYNKWEVGESRAVITATADLLGHGIFDHPLTDMVYGTVFVRANADLSDKGEVSKIGFITELNEQPQKFGKFRKQYANAGINQLHRRGGYFVQGPVESDNQARYVYYMQQALAGVRNYKVRIPPFLNEGQLNEDGTRNPGWIQTVLTNLSIEDYEERLEARNTSISNALQEQQTFKKTAGEVRKVLRGERKLDKTMTVRVYGTEKDEVDISKLTPQTLTFHKDGEEPVELDWDSGIAARIMVNDFVDQDWAVELES